jgi:hypothetical protein
MARRRRKRRKRRPGGWRRCVDRTSGARAVRRRAQLVALARAFARRRSIILLDEPFSALIVLLTIRAARGACTAPGLGLTTLQVTHDFTEAGCWVTSRFCSTAAARCSRDTGRRLPAPGVALYRRVLGAENVLAGTVLDDVAPDWLEGESAAIAHGYRAIEFSTGPLTLYTVGDFVGRSRRDRRQEIVLSPEAPSGWRAIGSRGTWSEIATLGALTRVTVDAQRRACWLHR